MFNDFISARQFIDPSQKTHLEAVIKQHERLDQMKIDLERTSSNVEDKLQQVKQLESAIETLKQSGVESESVEATLTGNIATLRDSIVRLESVVKSSTEKIDDQKQFIKRLEQTFREHCTHVNMVYDYTDYHKNEDFYRCLVCGTIR